jgi:phosphate transport system permease protein
MPQSLEQLDAADALYDGRIYTQVRTGDYRTIEATHEVGEPVQVSDHPIIAIDYQRGGTVERPTIAFATVDAQNIARISQSRVQRNLMTGEETVTTSHLRAARP